MGATCIQATVRYRNPIVNVRHVRGTEREKACLLHTSVRLCHLHEFTCRHNQGMN